MSATDLHAFPAAALRIGGPRSAPVLSLAAGLSRRSGGSLIAAVSADGTVRIVDVASKRVVKGIPSAAFAQRTIAASDVDAQAAQSQGEDNGPSVCTWLPRSRSTRRSELLVAAGTTVHVFDFDPSDPVALLKQARRLYDGVGHDELNVLLPLPLPLPPTFSNTDVDAEADGDADTDDDGAIDRIAFADDEGNIGTLSLADSGVRYFEHVRKGKRVKAHDRICTSLILLPSSSSAAAAAAAAVHTSDAERAVAGEAGAEQRELRLVSGGLDCRVRFWHLAQLHSSGAAQLVAEIDVVAQRASEAASLQVVNPPYVNCLASLALPRSATAGAAEDGAYKADESAGVLVAVGLGDGGVLLYDTAEPFTDDAPALGSASLENTATPEAAASGGKNRAERRKAEKAARKAAPKPRPAAAAPETRPPGAAVVDGVRQIPNGQIVSLAAHGHAVTCLALSDAASPGADTASVVLLTGSADSTLKVWRIQPQSAPSIARKESGGRSAEYKLETTLLRTVRLGGKPNDIALLHLSSSPRSDSNKDEATALKESTQVAVALTDGTVALFDLDTLNRAE